MAHPSLRQAPLLLAVLAALSSAACSSPPPRDTDADAEKQVVRLGNSVVNILYFCQRNPVTCCRHFPSFCEATQKQDAEDYRRLWKNPRAFCESYMSRHSVSLDIIWPQEIQLYGLAACAENGWGVPYQDRERLLIRWLSISAHNEDLDARKRLIDIYLNGWEGQKPDAAEAIKWMEPLAQDGSLSKDELYRLAELLETDRKGDRKSVV